MCSVQKKREQRGGGEGEEEEEVWRAQYEFKSVISDQWREASAPAMVSAVIQENMQRLHVSQYISKERKWDQR